MRCITSCLTMYEVHELHQKEMFRFDLFKKSKLLNGPKLMLWKYAIGSFGGWKKIEGPYD